MPSTLNSTDSIQITDINGADNNSITIKYLDPITGKYKTVTANTVLPLNAILKVTSEATLGLLVNGERVVIQVSPDNTADIKSSIESATPTEQAEPEASETYQPPLPSLQTGKESSTPNPPSARTSGVEAAPVVNLRTDIDGNDDSKADRIATTIESLETQQVLITPEESRERKISTPAPLQGTITPPSEQTVPALQIQPPIAASITGITPDTGFFNNDFLTNQPQFTLIGLAPGADTVKLICNNQPIDTVPVKSDGTWTSDWIAPAETVAGQFNFIAYSQISGVKGSPSEPVLVDLKTSTPLLTIDNSVTETLLISEFKVTGHTGGFNRVTFKSGEFSETKTLGIDGTFEFDLHTEKLTGQFIDSDDKSKAILTYLIEVEDAAGNQYVSEPHFYEVPHAPLNLRVTPDTGIQDDNITNKKEVYVEGDSRANHPLKVQVGSLAPLDVTSNAETGHWKTPELALDSDGLYPIKVWYTNDLQQQHVAKSAITLDTSVPEFEKGFLSEEIHSREDHLTLQVKTETGYVVKGVIKDGNGIEISSAETTAANTAQLELAAPEENGKYSVELVITNPAGTDSVTLTQAYIYDTKSPEAPELEILTEASVIDGISYQATQIVKLKVMAEAGSKLTFTDQEEGTATPTGKPESQEDGEVYTFDTGGEGTFNYFAKCVDKALNESPISKVATLQVDKAAPSVLSISGSGTEQKLTAGETLTIQVTFNKPVTLEDYKPPKLALELDEKSVKADYTSISDDRTIVHFSYTVVDGDNAPNGVSISQNAILPLSAITGRNGLAVIEQPAETKITTLLVDAKAPEPPTIKEPSLDSSTQQFTTKELEVDVRGIAEAHSRVQLYDAETQSPLTAKAEVDDQGKWNIRLKVAESAGIEILTTVYAKTTDGCDNISKASTSVPIFSDSKPPSITDIQGSTVSLRHPIGDIIPITVTFSEQIQVSGIPKLNLELNNKQVQATGRSDPQAGNSLVFEYTVDSDDPTTPNIIVPVEAFVLEDGATILDTAGNSASLTTLQPYHLDDGINADPAIIEFGSNISEGLLKKDDVVSVTVKFNKPLTITADGESRPTIPITFDSGEKTAILDENSQLTEVSQLAFEYTIEAGDNAGNGITISPMRFNGASFLDKNNTSLEEPTATESTYLAKLTADTAPPELLKVTIDTPSTKKHTNGSILKFVATISEVVTLTTNPEQLPTLVITIGKDTHTLTATPNLVASSEIVFKHEITDENGIIATKSLTAKDSSVVDAVGLTLDTQAFSPKSYPNHMVDSTIPTVTNISLADAQKTGTADRVFTFTVALSKEMTFGDEGKPTLPINIGDKVFQATLTDSKLTGVNQLVFSHTLTGAEPGDVNGIEAGPMELNGASVTDTQGITLNLDTGKAQNFPEARVDTPPPVTVTNIQPASETSRFHTGEKVTIAVTTSSPVSYESKTTELRPELTLLVGKTTVNAGLVGEPVDTKTLLFEFTADETHLDIDGISPQGLKNSELLTTENGAILQSAIDAHPLNIFVGSEFPKVVESPGIKVHGHDLEFYDQSAQLYMEASKYSANPENPAVNVSFSAYTGTMWSNPKFPLIETTESNGKLLHLHKSINNKPFIEGRSLTFQIHATDTEGKQTTSLYKAWLLAPTHHYSFDHLTKKGENESYEQSSSLPRDSTKAYIEGSVNRVTSPISLGNGLEFKGGHLKTGSMSSVFSDAFTLCTWIKTTAIGQSETDPSLNPALIGEPNGLSLMGFTPLGKAYVASGQSYGAVTDVKISDGALHHVCLVVSKKAPISDQGAYRWTQFFVDGKEGSEKTEMLTEEITEAEYTVIGGLSTAPWEGVVDDTTLVRRELSADSLASTYTQYGVVTLRSGQFQDLGMMALQLNKQLPAGDEVYLKVTDAKMSNPDNTKKMVPIEEVEIQCKYMNSEDQEVPVTLDLKATYSLPATGLASLQCKIPTPVSKLSLSLDTERGDIEGKAPDAKIVISKDVVSCPIGSGCIRFHDGPYQIGNKPMNEDVSRDVFSLDFDTKITNLGYEDTVVLGPQLKELIAPEDSDTAMIGAALNKLFHNYEISKTHTIFVSTEDDHSAASITPHEPIAFHVLVDDQSYLINPYIV